MDAKANARIGANKTGRFIRPAREGAIDPGRSRFSLEKTVSAKDLRFLVVEDQQVQRAIIVALLKSLGATNVVEAIDGYTGLDAFRNTPGGVDIIVSDLRMPGMDGMEFIRHLGAIGHSFSVIFISALDRSLLTAVETMAAAYGITVLGSLEKPVSPRRLQSLIQQYRPRDPLSEPTAVHRAFSVDEIMAGLESDQFEPFFQPKVRMANGRVTGAEALARWRHPFHGIVGPSAFINLLEDNGLIDKLTWIMLRKAAAFCGKLRSMGLESTVSVNLSLKSLNDACLAELVCKIIRNEGVEPHHMVLEVTESSAMTDVPIALENLARLRMEGFGLSIDDYGIGYSSMQQLARIAFTELKIDQSFVMNAIRHSSSQVILASSLGMAKKLGIAAVAEGVATKEHWQLLSRLGCASAQGYFIAEPMQCDSYLDWVRAR